MVKKLNLKKKKGFTLIELIIVVAILGILAGIAIPKFSSAQKDAKINADIANAKNIASAAAILIAKDAIEEGTTASSTVYKADDKYDLLTNVGATIADELQSVPTPTAVSGSFYVSIDESGNVTVYAGSIEEGKSNEQVYPNPSSGTYHK